MTTNQEIILSASDVEVQFTVRGKQLRAIRNISIDLYKDETLAIVGESGSGKSQTMYTIMGLLSENALPVKGKVTFDVERCKSCGLCVEACPKGILAIDTDYINQKGYNPAKVVDEEKCVGCASCALMCPDVVITVERD